MKRLEHKAWENNRFADRPGSDDFAALHGGANDGTARTDAAIQGLLEIGTGSGYQTGVFWRIWYITFAPLSRIKGLQWQARRRLKQLDLHNVSTRHGDGWQGWQARAPFDAIIVTAAPPEIPNRAHGTVG